MVDLNDVMAPASGVISREAERELVVVLPEQGKFLVLNGTGAVAFRLMDGQCTLEEMAAALGERYGIPFDRARDDVLAYMWYSIATQQTGDEWLRAIAGSNRDALAPRMTPADIAEAQRRATEWRAKHGG